MGEAADGPRPNVRVPKAAELVASHLRQQIVRGDIGLGQPLPAETELRDIYSVSRPTLREALRILESEALIVVKRGARGGARAALPDGVAATRAAGLLLQVRGTTLSEVFAARRIIEPAAVRLFVERPTSEGIFMLETAHDAECALRHRWDQYNVASAAFHARVVEACANRPLIVCNELLLAIVQHHHRAMFRQSEDQFEGLVASAIDSHRTLIELVRAGDADAAEEHWRHHIDEAAGAALRWLGEQRVIDLFDDYN